VAGASRQLTGHVVASTWDYVNLNSDPRKSLARDPKATSPFRTYSIDPIFLKPPHISVCIVTNS
jgi:hypothetical protein